jgi:AraC-like DNA-binding protein
MGPSTQFTDYIVALIVQSIRDLLQRKTWVPLRVELQQRQPKSVVPFQRVLGRNVTFGSDVNSVVVDAATLRAPVKSADAGLYRLLVDLADKELDSLRVETKFIDRARNEMEISILSGKARIERVAAAMGLSVRKLQRRLEGSGKPFRELLEETRQALAMRLLIDTDRSIKDISYTLGFSEPSAFSRAARKWFGTSPRAIRAREARNAKE